MRAAIVFNPIKADERALRKAIAAAQPPGWEEALWFETSADDAGASAAREACDAGVDVVLVAGGDGTVRAVAEVLADSDVALALLPAGTGNLLARNIGIDVTFLRSSVRTAFDGNDRKIDVGWAEVERESGEREKRAFTVAAGFGLDAAMVENADSTLKKRVGWFAYVDAIARSVRTIRRVRMKYRMGDGQQRAVGLNTLIVGNCGILTGNVVLLPDAKIDDGLLDIAIIRPKDVYGWLQVIGHIAINSALLHRVLRRRKLIGPTKPVPTLGYGQAESFDARLDEPAPFEVDGDLFGEAIAMRFTIARGALTVKVPQREATWLAPLNAALRAPTAPNESGTTATDS